MDAVLQKGNLLSAVNMCVGIRFEIK